MSDPLSKLSDLESRLCLLDSRVLGSQETKRPLGQQSLLQSLAETNERLLSLTAGRERFSKVLEEISSLESVLQQRTGDECDPLSDPLSDPIQKDLLLQDLLQEVVSQEPLLQEIKAKRTLLDKNHLDSFHDLVPEVERLRILTIRQLKESVEINQETQRIISLYNDMMSSVKETLREIDSRLKRTDSSESK